MVHRVLAALVVVSGCAQPPSGEDTPEVDLDSDVATGEGKADGTAGQLVFLNFGGARIHQGDCSDAPSDCSSLVSGTQDLAPFTVSDEWERPKVVAAITRCVGMFFSDMDVAFVTTRPAAGPYTMMVIGAIYPTQLGFPQNGSGPYGRAPVDCANHNKSDVGFLLLEGDVNPDFYYMCRSIAHEVGHTFGMKHTGGDNAIVGDRVDVMCETDACRNAAATGAAKWDVVNRAMLVDGEACDGTDRQNTYARLMDVLGV